MIIHTNKENAPKIMDFDNPKEIGHFGLMYVEHRRKELIPSQKISYLNPPITFKHYYLSVEIFL